MIIYQQRGGLTLIELVTVIAIIGILVGLSLPAIHQVRAETRRTSCSNQVRQIALALLSFESTMGHLPSGILPVDDEQFASSTWLTQLLPFVERQNLWEQTVSDYSRDPIPFQTHLGMRTPVSLYTCPSDPNTGQANWTHENRLVASTNYLGVNGTNYRERDGVFYLNSKTTLASITDGLSNTLMIGERPPSPDFWYGWWYAGFGRHGSGAPDMLLGVAEYNDPSSFGITYLESCGPGPFQFGPGSSQNQCDTLHFWSHHAGGANFANCDGSTRMLTYTIDVNVINAIATRNLAESFEFPSE